MEPNFYQFYPNSAADLQLRSDNPAWPQGTWRICADLNVAPPHRTYLTKPYDSQDEAIQAAEDAYNQSLKGGAD